MQQSALAQTAFASCWANVAVGAEALGVWVMDCQQASGHAGGQSLRVEYMTAGQLGVDGDGCSCLSFYLVAAQHMCVLTPCKAACAEPGVLEGLVCMIQSLV